MKARDWLPEEIVNEHGRQHPAEMEGSAGEPHGGRPGPLVGRGSYERGPQQRDGRQPVQGPHQGKGAHPQHVEHDRHLAVRVLLRLAGPGLPHLLAWSCCA